MLYHLPHPHPCLWISLLANRSEQTMMIHFPTLLNLVVSLFDMTRVVLRAGGQLAKVGPLRAGAIWAASGVFVKMEGSGPKCRVMTGPY
uniref:Uncharacterized protein n=1 Tax=Salix viminalis TaxID=40686 RepID=A0A6N2KQZ8_SALVM